MLCALLVPSVTLSPHETEGVPDKQSEHRGVLEVEPERLSTASALGLLWRYS